MIHLRTPRAANYTRSNPLRIESAEEAALIDERIAQAWSVHPRRFVVDGTDDFLEKAHAAIEALRLELPGCCRAHVLPNRIGGHKDGHEHGLPTGT